MSKLRIGDTVLFRARVTGVEPYNGNQQIMAKLLPTGKELGWCVPGEYDFTVESFVIKVGDSVRWNTDDGGKNSKEYRIQYIDEDAKQAVVKAVGEWPIYVAPLEKLVRTS